jgi:CRISPR/Cas system-associated exonuclease Cas4 (RecB family)
MSKARILTKSDFLSYCVCRKDFWLRKNRPDIYKKPELTLFFQKLIRDGYEVEKYAKKLFPDAHFQKQIQTEDGLYAELDIFQDGNIYEVKSSSEIKTDLEHNHIKDITFQTIVAERSGVKVDKSFIIHINKEYIKDGEINPFGLLKLVDVTDRVVKEKEQVGLMMDEALRYMNEENIDITKCECINRSAGQRCDSFSVLNPTVPKYSVQHIFTGKKLKELVAEQIFDPKDVPEDFEMTKRQKDRVYLQKIGEPTIDEKEIKNILNKLVYPLYFFDYETLGKPVPLLNGYRPNQNLVFQYSLHKLNSDGSLEHFEYLANDFENATFGLVKALREQIGSIGSIISWHAIFERDRNKELGKLHPESAEFFRDMNSRMYDLKLIFQNEYLHPKFNGSASIKKVLPVLLPELSYKSLNIQDGTMAMTEWERMVKLGDVNSIEFQEIRNNLLEYCKLDTYAMVKIFEVLKSL